MRKSELEAALESANLTIKLKNEKTAKLLGEMDEIKAKQNELVGVLKTYQHIDTMSAEVTSRHNPFSVDIDSVKEPWMVSQCFCEYLKHMESIHNETADLREKNEELRREMKKLNTSVEELTRPYKDKIAEMVMASS